jgi:hypothetical protein
VPESSHLSAVPDRAPRESVRTRGEELPGEIVRTPEEAPDLLAALDRGDEEAVYAWFRAHGVDKASLAVYALLIGAGITGLVEWPALVLTAIAQVIVDRRLGGIENVVGELRSIVEGRA